MHERKNKLVPRLQLGCIQPDRYLANPAQIRLSAKVCLVAIGQPCM